jgi:ABC-type branched-subunit amino acid transport system substrate-binding protein
MFRFVFVLILIPFNLSFAQFKIGVILSQTGQGSVIGQQQTRAIRLLSSQLKTQGVFSKSLEIILRDDASSAQETFDQAKDLIENQGVIALVCCTLTSNLKAISDYVNSQSIITLSPSDLPDSSDWLFSTKPNLEHLLQSVILQLSAKGQQSIGVMAIDTPLGTAVESTLNLLLSPGGMHLGVFQGYWPDAAVLTPEALWVATRLPETVLVWGLPRDSALAYQALRERGYEREIILNPVLLSGGLNLLEVEGASFILSPVQVASSLPNTHPNYLNSFRFASEMAQGGAVSVDGAYAYDALNLIKAALEQVLTYGIPVDDIPALRYGLRDAFIGLVPYNGVAAVYNYTEADHLGLEPLSLVIAKVSQGKLIAKP